MDISEYEKKRLSNIKENSELLKTLGIDVIKRNPFTPTVNAGHSRRRKGRQRQCYYSSSSDSEDDWYPGIERVPVTRVPKLKVPQSPDIHCTADFYSTSENIPQSTCPEVKSTDCNGPELPDWLQSESSDDEEFHGYVIEDEKEDVPVVESALKDKWFEQFGHSDSETKAENNFEGFELDEVDNVPKLMPSRQSSRCKGKVVYVDEDLSDEDHYLFCEDCHDLHHGECPVHGPLKQLDPSTGYDECSKSYTSVTVPFGFTVKTSSLTGAGLGVFVVEDIPKGVRFGPYEGMRILKSDLIDTCDTSYMWEIKPSIAESYLIDGKSDDGSCWLKFVNCARNEEEQNLVAFQFHGNIFYRSFKHIPKGSELFVWYGEQYARDLGISVNYSSDYLHICNHCGASFREKSSFDAHLRRSKLCFNANPHQFVCRKCEERFVELHQLQHHIRRHEFNRCGSLGKNEQTKVFNNHYNESSKPEKCKASLHENITPPLSDNCSKAFIKKERTHTGVKSFKCQYCNYRTSRQSALTTHIRTHTGEKPFKCQYCNYRTSQQCALTAHIRTHTGEKPFKCQYCNYRTSQQCALTAHIRTHTGEKPFKCQYCNYRTSLQNALTAHIRTHTGEKPFKCQYCDYRASQQCNLTKHIRRTHT